MRTNFCFLFIGFLALLFILYFKVTHGLDFSDETQYYLQIKGLTDYNLLFSNDLFIQQVGYTLFYPIFLIYKLIIGYDALILFGRLILALLIVILFFWTQRVLCKEINNKIVSILAALILIFPVNYHGDFALNYNSIAQILFIFFALIFYNWEDFFLVHKLALITMLSFLIYPTLSILTFFLTFLRFIYQKDYINSIKFILWNFIFFVFIFLYLLLFTSYSSLVNAFIFSSGFGIATTLLSDSKNIFIFIFIFISPFIVFYYIKNNINIPLKLINNLILAFLIAFCLAIALNFSSSSYSQRVVALSSILLILIYTFGNYLLPINKVRKINWLLLAIISYSFILALTSGNGIGQSVGGLYIGAPLVFALLCEKNSKYVSKKSILFLILILYSMLWLKFPYRDTHIWKSQNYISQVKEYKYIRTSSEQTELGKYLKDNLEDLLRNQKTIVIGNYPATYLILNLKPETCMIYMHSLSWIKQSHASERVLNNCLSTKTPSFILEINDNRDFFDTNRSVRDVVFSNFKNRNLILSNKRTLTYKNFVINIYKIKYQ